MPEITIISGKGGTGKTSITASFARLAENLIICDLDVDAPDLHLLLRPEILETHEFRAGHTAVINAEACGGCTICIEACRFDAISSGTDTPRIDESACEGCGVCAHFCPDDAISMHERHAGNWFRSQTPTAPMIHGELYPGSENSGLLVSTLRRVAKAESEASGRHLILADGPPGIGCPVISSISTTDFVVLVTEPTLSGVHDLERAVDLCAHFERPAGVIINKADLDPTCDDAITRLCAMHHLPILARIPFDKVVVDALMSGWTMVDLGAHPIAQATRTAWRNVLRAVSESQPVEHVLS